MPLIHLLRALAHDEQGATAIEYAIVLGLIAVGLAAAATTLGGSIAAELGEVGTLVSAVITP